MKTLEISEATEPLGQYVVKDAEDLLVLTDAGEPVAALVSLRNVDQETLALSTNPDFIALLQASRSRLKAEGGICLEEMRRRVELSD